MSYNKIWKLTFNGFEVPIYVVNASFEATRPNPDNRQRDGRL